MGAHLNIGHTTQLLDPFKNQGSRLPAIFLASGDSRRHSELLVQFCHCGSKPMGSHFGLDEFTTHFSLVGIGMFTGGTGF